MYCFLQLDAVKYCGSVYLRYLGLESDCPNAIISNSITTIVFSRVQFLLIHACVFFFPVLRFGYKKTCIFYKDTYFKLTDGVSGYLFSIFEVVFLSGNDVQRIFKRIFLSTGVYKSIILKSKDLSFKKGL